jgi:polyisoprenoid-binding protein YceI
MAFMMKITIALLVLAAAVGGWAWYASSQSDRGPIGAPVLSMTPSDEPESPAAFLDGVYALVTASSSMTWQGSKPLLNGYFDTGTIALKDGATTVRDGVVASGSVVVDMTSISTLSTGRGSGNETQANHLKSADFFDASKYPTSTFVLTGLTPHAGDLFSVDGTLTMHGFTQPVAFSATVVQKGDTLVMTAKDVVLDRTLWEVRYGSGKFFKELVGEKLIGDTFTLSFTAVGKLSK